MRLTVALALTVLALPLRAEVYHGVAVAPDAMNAWVVTIETTAVYHTSNFGTSWEPQDVPTFRDFFDIFFLDALNGWTCGRVGDIWHTSDGGANWARQNLGGPKFATRIRFLDSQHGWASGGEAILLHTANGGEEWDMTFFPRPPYPADTVDFQGVFFISPTTGWLVAGRFPEGGDTFAFGQGFITKTLDACTTWTLQRQDTVYDFYDVAFNSADEGWVVGGNDRTMKAVVMHTTDGGTSWAEQTVPDGARFLRAVTFIGNHGWACGRNGTIIHTSDAGANWALQPTSVDTTLFDIDFADTLHGMASGNAVVLYTTNGGASWHRGLGGIEERPERMVNGEWRMTIVPNPAADLATVRFEGGLVAGWSGVLVRVFDATGRCVLARNFELRTSNFELPEVPLDIRSLSSGVYLARLDAPGRAATQKLLVQR